MVPLKSVIAVGVASNYQTDGAIRLKAYVDGVAYFDEEMSLLDGKYIYSIVKKALPEGVTTFTAFNESQVPIAERLYFNNHKDLNQYTNSEIEKFTADQNNDIIAKMTDNSISAYLNGPIESLSSYFISDDNLHIDNLMLTQGWRNYKYQKPSNNNDYVLDKKN